MDVPSAGVVVRGDDGFLERNSVRARISNQRAHEEVSPFIAIVAFVTVITVPD